LKSLQKVSSILSCFERHAHALTLQEIATRTGQPKASVHRHLTALKQIGFVVQDARRDRYRLGLHILALGGVVLANLDMIGPAREPAATLSRQSGEKVHLCVFDGRNVVSIDRNEMARDTNEITRIEREPPYCTSTGKAILAALPAAHADLLIGEDMPGFTPNTITDKAALLRDLAATRARGYAIDDEERQRGIRCVGAPIRKANSVVGAISVTGSCERMVKARLPALAELVTAAAARIKLALEG